MKRNVFTLVLIMLLAGCTSKQSEMIKVSMYVEKRPVLTGKAENEMIHITVNSPEMKKQIAVTGIDLNFNQKSEIENLSSIKVYHKKDRSGPVTPDLFGISKRPQQKNRITGKSMLTPGNDFLIISLAASKDADIDSQLELSSIRIHFSNRLVKDVVITDGDRKLRFGLVLRAAGQDSCNTYRIPGIVTTSKGTLVAVYDNRYNSSKDLQEDIDIGMSRSTDGGITWEPMKVIMDMGSYGGRPERMNGTGDPSILFDDVTGTIFVAALWMSGASPDQMLWNASKPGMKPEETGQIMLVKSTDDGLTWSKPESISGQIKDPSWQLLFQGPGRGITMKDGTLVFPAQFKTDIGNPAIDGGKYTCHSTIIYSSDRGNRWHIGTGAKANTTESQVVELGNGTLMLNMRDDRNRNDKGPSNGRAVAVTTDMGKTWTAHPSSNSALPEPNCMASLISADLKISGEIKKVLFFSNPANRESRSNLTIKASLDGGETWPPEYQEEIYSPRGYGYSCLTMIDSTHIGILYEGIRELYFQKIPVEDILEMKKQ